MAFHSQHYSTTVTKLHFPSENAAWSNQRFQFNTQNIGLLISEVYCSKLSTSLIFRLKLLAIPHCNEKGCHCLCYSKNTNQEVPLCENLLAYCYSILNIKIAVSFSWRKCSLLTRHLTWKCCIMHANQAAFLFCVQGFIEDDLGGRQVLEGDNMSPVTCRWHKIPN